MLGVFGCVCLVLGISLFVNRFFCYKSLGVKENDGYIDMALSGPVESETIAPYDPEIFN